MFIGRMPTYKLTKQPDDGVNLICTKCKVMKPYAGFYANARAVTYGGYSMPCIECHRAVCNNRTARLSTGVKPGAPRKVAQPQDGSTLVCIKCLVQKEFSGFYAQSKPTTTYCGYQMPCKECSKECSRAQRYSGFSEARKSVYRKCQAEYRSKPEVKAKRNAARKNRRSTPEGRACHARCQRIRSLTYGNGIVTADDWKNVILAFGNSCVYCLDKPDKLTTDHVVPVSKNGAHSVDNIVPACFSCNLKKSARNLSEFLSAQRIDTYEFLSRLNSGREKLGLEEWERIST